MKLTKSRLLPLMLIMLLVWLLIFLGSYIVFNLIVPVNFFPNRTDYIFSLLDAFLKVILSATLSIIWFMIMIKLRDIYIKRKLLN